MNICKGKTDRCDIVYCKKVTIPDISNTNKAFMEGIKRLYKLIKEN